MRFRLFTGTIWLVFGTAMLGAYATDKPILNIQPSVLLMLGIIATALGVFRLWSVSVIAKRRRMQPPPVRRRPVSSASMEYNPDFDFNRPGPQTLSSNDDTPKS